MRYIARLLRWCRTVSKATVMRRRVRSGVTIMTLLVTGTHMRTRSTIAVIMGAHALIRLRSRLFGIEHTIRYHIPITITVSNITTLLLCNNVNLSLHMSNITIQLGKCTFQFIQSISQFVFREQEISRAQPQCRIRLPLRIIPTVVLQHINPTHQIMITLYRGMEII